MKGFLTTETQAKSGSLQKAFTTKDTKDHEGKPLTTEGTEEHRGFEMRFSGRMSCGLELGMIASSRKPRTEN